MAEEKAAAAKDMEMESESSSVPASSTIDTAKPLPSPMPAVQEASPASPPVRAPRSPLPAPSAEATLKEAFPAIDSSVIRAVLIASNGQIEPAFNALLTMNDPSAQTEPAPPTQPPRPIPSPTVPTSTSQSQVDADAMYARQLAEYYQGAAAQPRPSRPARESTRTQRTRRKDETDLKPNELYDRDHSFFDDDLPVIQQQVKEGFQEARTQAMQWIAKIKKRIDGEDEPIPALPPRRGQGVDRFEHGADDRRRAERERYDADPQVLGDDFGGLQMEDNEANRPTKPPRPQANPNLFKPTPATPSATDGSGRRVSFQHETTEIPRQSPRTSSDMRSPGRIASPAAAALGTKGNSKWEPLSTVEPSPVADHDPFSLGDSDDEKDAVEKVVGKAPEPVKEAGDGERLGDTAERKAVGGVKVGEASGGGESEGAKIEGEKRAAS